MQLWRKPDFSTILGVAKTLLRSARSDFWKVVHASAVSGATKEGTAPLVRGSLPFPMAPARILAGRREAVVPHFSNLLCLFLQPKICIKFQSLQKLVFWTILAIFCDIFANFT